LKDRITNSVADIADGRRGLAVNGSAEAGLVSFQTGMNDAMAVFQEIAVSGDAKTMILIEHAFLTEEKRFCVPSNKAVLGSLTHAIDSFDDALRILPVVENAPSYQCVDMAFPRHGDYRVEGMPKDALHLACIAHRTRLNNTLKTPGLNPTELTIYQQRAMNMGVIKKVYIALQKTALMSDYGKYLIALAETDAE
jgi:hypothetical protein